MTLQVVPYLSQADMLDPQTYRELGFWGAIFAISLLVIVFSVIKGHIKLIGCGPIEGGIREFFGITLWKAGSGPHLHVAGIFAFRKVSFAMKEIDPEGEVNRFGTVYLYSIRLKVRVRRTKESIRRRVYDAEDLNRGDAENDEAIKQLTTQLIGITREVLEADTPQDDIERAIMDHWGQIELAELHGTATDLGKSTYGYELLCSTTRKLVEREDSEIARAIRGTDLDQRARAVSSIVARRERTA